MTDTEEVKIGTVRTMVKRISGEYQREYWRK